MNGFQVGLERGRKDGFAKARAVSYQEATLLAKSAADPDASARELSENASQQDETHAANVSSGTYAYQWNQPQQLEQQYVEPQPIRQQHPRSTGTENPGLDVSRPAAPMPKISKPRAPASHALASSVFQPSVCPPTQVATTARMTNPPQSHPQTYTVDMPHQPLDQIPWVTRPTQQGCYHMYGGHG